MEISIFGLGYVGCVSAACLAADGHNVLGVDPNSTKVELINQGNSPIVEPGLPELILSEQLKGRLRATVSCTEAIAATELSFICIGTPSAPNGSLDLRYVIRVAEEIGAALRTKMNFIWLFSEVLFCRELWKRWYCRQLPRPQVNKSEKILE